MTTVLTAADALGAQALALARAANASWCDVRIALVEREEVSVRNGEVAALEQDEQTGFGVRVMIDGCWGFASGFDLTGAELERVTKLAIALAKSGRRAGPGRHQWADEPAWRDRWTSTWLIDPFSVPLDRKIDLLLRADAVLRQRQEIASTSCNLSFRRETQTFISSAGARIEQVVLRSGGGIAATAHQDGESQTRSYPSAFGGQFMAMGWELIESMDLVGAAPRVRDEAIALLSAESCPVGETDIILSGDQLALQIHESVGHATELDRVHGWEANHAGTSFVDPGKLEQGFRYGSPLVNLVCDATAPGGLASVGYDDDGVRSQRWHLVCDGVFVGYQTSRDTAHLEAQARGGSAAAARAAGVGPDDPPRSRGCSRAEGPSHVPIVRISNLSLLPGDWRLADLIADTQDGIWMDGVKCWSIDQQRLNFQFTCEYGRQIKGGRLGRLLKNPTYQGITPQFWGACDAICGPDEWTLWGVPNCGKGQPHQTAEMSHGAAPARFRKIAVGVRS
ncbi:MAG TPA: TldD/PmbA family protein [Planctomycetota bacterium]|nr:TldD/PmbA family protein [Planctomycetota bacterium]